jgi:hypothetical protein
MELSNLQERIAQLERAQSEMRQLKTTLDDALKENEQYQEVDLATRELATKKKRIKDEIWGQATYQEAVAKIKDIKEEVNDISEILNHELLEWRQHNQSDEIIGSDGTPRKLKINVRLQHISSRFNE